ncbi:hypothetical protein [Halorubellus litoreus]|uniref:TAT (Twin-arginine translocation) pathway signal sequence n=1 Tax=Halorubellus litoreus TaxID=755308 RepID=A0ABD5VF04_9EURY
MPTRRRALALLGGALAATSGCVSRVLDDDPPLEHGDRMRAIGDPASRTLDGWPPDHAYVPANDTVRDTDDSGTEAYTDAAVWAAWVGEDTAIQVVANRFDPSLHERRGIVFYPAGQGRERHLNVHHQTRPTAPRETGTIDPDLSTTELVERAPETVSVTVPLHEQTWTIDYPVFVKRYDLVEHTAAE